MQRRLLDDNASYLNEKTVADLTELSVDTFRSSLEQNLVSVFITIRAALPHIRQATGDRSITLTSSTDAFLSYGLAAYAAAKGGLIGMVHSLAVPLGREGLRINAVAPGDVPTARNVAEFGHIPDWYVGLTNATALGRLCSPADTRLGFCLSPKIDRDDRSGFGPLRRLDCCRRRRHCRGF